MSLAALKAAGFALALLTVGLPVYLTKLIAPEAVLPKDAWATPGDTPVFEIAWMPTGDALHGVINPAGSGVHNVATSI